MKIIVVSDSHGKAGILEQLVDIHRDADMFLHCGDIEDAPADHPMYQIVLGNNDFFFDLPSALVATAQAHKIYMTHGHLLPFHRRHKELVKKAKEHGCDIACYGHSHIAVLEELDDVLIVNPGSLWRSRDSRGPSYAILEVSEQGVHAHIEFLKKQD